ncbi:cell division protein ZapB [Thermodesulfobacteriota bacterium]
MDNELILREFDKIEKKVERLIEVLKTLEATNSELRNKIESLNTELQDRVATEKNYAEERDLIRSKIDSLLVKLEDISEVE